MKNCLLLFLLFCITATSFAQNKKKHHDTELVIQSTIFSKKNKKLSDALVVFRPMIYVNYNFYHWAQEPVLNNAPQNSGQVFNVVPGLGAGFLLGKKTTLMFFVDGEINYYPFSIDLARYKGMGTLTFPVMAGFRIPLDGFFSLTVGGGVQWTQANLHQRDLPAQNYSNAFFMTYLGELGFVIEENIFLGYFLRFGYHPSQAMTFDFGLRFGLNGSLWE